MNKYFTMFIFLLERIIIAQDTQIPAIDFSTWLWLSLLLILPYVICLFIINLIVVKKKLKKRLNFKTVLISFFVAILEVLMGLVIYSLTYKWFI